MSLHENLFKKIFAPDGTRIEAVAPITMNGCVIQGVGKGSVDSDVATLGDIRNIKTYADALFACAQQYVDDMIAAGGDVDVFMGANEAFHYFRARDRVFTHTTCASTTCLLPALPFLKEGDRFAVIGGGGSGGWQIAQLDGHQIAQGNALTTAGQNGALKSTTPSSACKIVCASLASNKALFVVEHATTELIFS